MTRRERELESDNARLRATVDELRALVADLRRQLARQQLTIDRLTRTAFGRTSERSPGPTLGDPAVTCDRRVSVDGGAGPPPDESAPGPPRRGRHGRRRTPPELPVERVVIDLPAAEKACPCCGTERVRVGDGRDPDPSLLSIDSQTVKSAETVPDAGFDGGKKVKGRKRHVLVDSLGLVFAVAITSAGVSDAAGAEQVLRQVEGNRRLTVVLADSAYHRDTLYEHMAATNAGYRLNIVSKVAGQTVFIPQPKRWLVERYFSWLRGSRLLAREYEGREWVSRSNVYMRSMMLTLNMYQRQLAEAAPACAA